MNLKNLRNTIIFTSLTIIFIEFFGYKLVIIYFDNFHKKICINNTCINKVKGWIPLYVKENNKTFIFNMINEYYSPFKLDSTIKDFENGIVLVKNGNKTINIIKIIFIKNYQVYKEKIVKEYNYVNKTYYVKELPTTYKVLYPKKKIYMELYKNKDEIDFLKSFLNLN